MYNPGSDPDQLFGLLAACLRYVDLICDPADLVSKLAIRCNRFKFHKLEGWLWTMWSPSVIDWLYSKEGKIHFGPNSNSKVDRPPYQNQCDVRTSVRPWKAWLLSLTLGNQSWLVIWIKCPTQTLNTFSVFPSLQHFASAFCQAGPEASHHLSRRTQGRRYWTPCVHLSQKGRWGIVGITGGSFDIIWYLRPAHLKYFPWQSWWQFRLFRVSLRPDVPRNIVIKHDDRFDLIPDQMDVICFVKRNASDPHLAQDTWLLSMSILWRYADMLVSLSTH